MAVETPTDYYIASISLKHQLATRAMAATFGVHSTAALTPVAVASAVWGAFNTTVRPQMDTNVMTGPVSIHGGTPDDPVAAQNTETPVLGGLALSGPAVNCAVIMEKITTRGGRRGRGRTFWPSMLANTDLSEVGVITPAKLTSLGTTFTNLRTALASAQVPMVVLHSPGVSGTPAPDDVVSVAVDSIIGSQRRRLGR